MPAKQSRGDREKHATAFRAAVNVRSIFDCNQFQIVRRKDFPFRVVYLHSKGFSGAFVQNLNTFLAAGEEMTFTPLAQSNDHREQPVAAFCLLKAARLPPNRVDDGRTLTSMPVTHPVVSTCI